MTQPDLTADSLVSVPSVHAVSATVARLKELLTKKNLHLFAQIDHAAGAEAVGLALRPTQVLIFGDPRAGTPLMQSAQAIGLDLPLRILVWEDEAGKAWLTYTEPRALARRYGIADREETVAALGAGLAALARAAGS